jgi:hypothetical protein
MTVDYWQREAGNGTKLQTLVLPGVPAKPGARVLLPGIGVIFWLSNRNLFPRLFRSSGNRVIEIFDTRQKVHYAGIQQI